MLDFLTDQILPPRPSGEIPRDGQVRSILSDFSPENQRQLVMGGMQTGKTNLLSQFARQNRGHCISYFINDSPLMQSLQAFLYIMCVQMSSLLEKNSPPENMNLEDLKNLFETLSISLAQEARRKNRKFYYVIDGVEYILKAGRHPIAELFPPHTAPYSPYLLFSCRSSAANSLKNSLRCSTTEPRPFSKAETRMYLDGVGFSEKEVERVFKKCEGVPGYLRIVRDEKRSNHGYDIDNAPAELSSLVEKQVESVISDLKPEATRALQVVAVASVSLPLDILAEISELDESTLKDSLIRNPLVSFDPNRQLVSLANDLVKDSVLRTFEDDLKQITLELLDLVKENHPEYGLLHMALLEKTKDYQGLRNALSERAVLSSIETTGDINLVLKKFSLALEMAGDKGFTEDLIQWHLGIAAARSFVSHAVRSDEIKALLAIGRTKNALSRAYALSDQSVKIRLLARAYASMKDRGETVPQDALSELETMVKNLDLENLDKEIAQQIAVDLFPVLPDPAFNLLEKAFGRGQRRSVIETAIRSIEESAEESGQLDIGRALKASLDLESVAEILSSWLNDLPFSELFAQIEEVENTDAKEYILRQWCRQNREDENIVRAIDAWLDFVIGDLNFVVLLRSLRHMSEVVAEVPLSDRERLIQRLRGPSLFLLESPRQEWARFRLNLAKGLADFDLVAAREEIEAVHSAIVEEPLDLDVEVYCWSKLWAAVKSIFPEETNWISEIHVQFERSFDHLLANAADHLKPITNTIRALVDVDPFAALIEASDLNTYPRRILAIRLVLKDTLRKRGKEDLVDFIEQGFGLLKLGQRAYALVETTSMLSAREVTMNALNLEALLKIARSLVDPTLRCEVLTNLIGLFELATPNKVSEILEEAIESWRQEDDLKLRLHLGFKMVQEIGELDTEAASELYEEVNELKLHAGATLAAGELGSYFYEILELAIRSIGLNDFTQKEDDLRVLTSCILRIPSQVMRVGLFSKLAASAYRDQVGFAKYGDEVVRDRLIPAINNIDSDLDYGRAVHESLPVIFEYDAEAALSLASKLEYGHRDSAWYSVVRWSLSRGFLGDHYYKPKNLRIKSDYPRLQKTLYAVEQIDYDILLQQAITAISRSVYVSFRGTLDAHQAHDMLQKLDSIAVEKLPEKEIKNIEHEGYRILAEASINEARSIVYHKARRKVVFSKKKISRKWIDLTHRARSIQNIADRVLVMAMLAQDMQAYYQDNRTYAKQLLKDAGSLIVDIPTLIDRIDRLQAVAEAWDYIGEKSRAQHLIERAWELINQLEGTSVDDRLSLLIQSAYEINPDLADELASRLDTRLPSRIIRETDVNLRVAELRSDPSSIDMLDSFHRAYGIIMHRTASKLVKDLAIGRGAYFDSKTMEKWLSRSSSYSPRISIDVAHWFIETAVRSQGHRSNLSYILNGANLALGLANWISTAHNEGIPEIVHDSFPALSAKYVTFGIEDLDKAQAWLEDWLRNNVKNYLKIFDPYFGPEELEYLRFVPMDCKVIIVTTNKYLNVTDGEEKLKEQLLRLWNSWVSRKLPHVQFIIIPYKDRFHDRAVISEDAGLDVGPSLNGLGKRFQKIAVLSPEDAQELEKAYTDKWLNIAGLFMDNFSPTLFSLGD